MVSLNFLGSKSPVYLNVSEFVSGRGWRVWDLVIGSFVSYFRSEGSLFVLTDFFSRGDSLVGGSVFGREA